MAQQKDDNKDLADALAALAAGDHVEPEAGEEHGSEHIEAVAPPPGPPPPPPARAATPQPAALRPAQPPTPPAPSSRARPASPAIPQQRPESPQRPPQPTAALIPPRGARPVSPTGVAPPSAPPPAAPSGEHEIIDDEVHPEDDAMLAPAPDRSVLAQTLPYRPSPMRRGISLEAKRTLIPILLTTGLLLLVFGTLRFVMGPDSPYAKMPNWLTALTGVAGIILLAGAFFTMLQVQHELDRK